MENFIFGIQAIGRTLSLTLRSAAGLELFWGFTIGFLLTTVLIGVLTSSDPRQLSGMLAKQTADSFAETIKLDKQGVYQRSYSRYRRLALSVKFCFGLAFFLFLLVIMVSIIRY